MKVLKSPKKRGSVILRVAVLAFSAYMLVILAQLRMQIGESQKQLDECEAQEEQLLQDIEEVESQLNNVDAYLEQHADEQGYAVPGESIYQEAQGAN